MNNTVMYQAKLHKIIFFWPVVLLIISLILGYVIYTNVPKSELISSLLALFAVIWIIMTWITYHFSSLIIKKKQVILSTGVLVRQIVDIQLNKVESIDIRQTIIGSILRYGSLVITGTGGTRHVIHFLSNPLTCRRIIEQMVHENV
jgi:uncharacterized membrane protein YdbT with pleckstrin-like domain